MENTRQCPLCSRNQIVLFSRDRKRDYLSCRHCRLIFTPPEFFLTPEEEKKHYDLHENNADDQGYRNFLDRLFQPLSVRLSPNSSGLDFGSGPGPTLSLMFEEIGHRMQIFDIYYAPAPTVLEYTYDFITATEVVEHLAKPGEVLGNLWKLLKPGGWLGLMTKQALDRESFNRWHYKLDPTHICFFSRETFVWLGQEWGVNPEFIGADVILFHKQVRHCKA